MRVRGESQGTGILNINAGYEGLDSELHLFLDGGNINVGQSCCVYIGGDVLGDETAGIYDVTKPVSKTDAAKQQCYSKIGAFARPAPPPGPPPAFDPNMPQNGNGQPMGPGPQGMGGPGPQMDGGNPPPPPPGGANALANSNGKTVFTMEGTVNGFQAVTDYAPVTYEDLEKGAYYYDAIQWAAGTKIATGITPTMFGPYENCTRGQTVLYLWRVAGSPQSGGVPPAGPQPGGMPPMGPQSGDMPPAQNMEPIQNPFEDVSESDEYYQAVLWAVQNGITNGVTDTLFKPQDTVTRAQSLTFLYRWTNPDSHEEENPFVDVSRGSYYYDAVLWAAKNKITTGTTATTFTPNSTLNKAYFLTFLYRYMEADLMPMQFGGPPPTGPIPSMEYGQNPFPSPMV